MRKLCTAALALLSAVAFLIVGSPSASAFGSEVLGCNVGVGWHASTCQTPLLWSTGTTVYADFYPANLSGTYGWSWTAYDDGVPVTTHCVSVNNVGCIVRGCTATSTDCEVQDHVGGASSITAYLTLTQSGRSETLAATATIRDSADGGCPKC